MAFLHGVLVWLAHSTFTTGAIELIIRSADGVLRRCRNLCLSAMLETVRALAGRTIDIEVVNRVLLQPHWQSQVDLTDF
jgi:MSHA biogenesis protein MshM